MNSSGLELKAAQKAFLLAQKDGGKRKVRFVFPYGKDSARQILSMGSMPVGFPVGKGFKGEGDDSCWSTDEGPFYHEQKVLVTFCSAEGEVYHETEVSVSRPAQGRGRAFQFKFVPIQIGA